MSLHRRLYMQGGPAPSWQFVENDFNYHSCSYDSGNDWIIGEIGVIWNHNAISKVDNIKKIRNEDLGGVDGYGAVGLDIQASNGQMYSVCDFVLVRGGATLTVRENSIVKYTHGSLQDKLRIEKIGDIPEYYINDVKVYTSLNSQADSYGWLGLSGVGDTLINPRYITA